MLHLFLFGGGGGGGEHESSEILNLCHETKNAIHNQKEMLIV